MLFRRITSNLILIISPILITGLAYLGFRNILIPSIVLYSLYSFYIYGQRLTLKSVNAEKIENKELESKCKEIAEKMNVDNPVLMKGKMGCMNAFAIGRKGEGTIVLSESLIKYLNDEEIEAVLGHEMSHLRSRDTSIMTIGKFMGYAIEHIGLLFKRHRLYPLHLIFTKIIYNIIDLPFLYISRRREFIADRDAAKFCDGDNLITALVKVNKINSKAGDMSSLDKSTKQICILGDSTKSKIRKIFSTHPPVEERIKRLSN
jgi:heat shock protein HtpX